MPSRTRRRLIPQRSTVRGRLVMAAVQVLLPIFALGIFGFMQLDRQSERFSQVAGEAAHDMWITDRLMLDLDAADVAGYAYIDDGSSAVLEQFDRVGEKVDAGLEEVIRLESPAERRLAEKAQENWLRVKQRVEQARIFRIGGRNVSAESDNAHDADMTAIDELVLGILGSSQAAIEAQVATERRERERDRRLLILPIAVGGLVALWVMARLARDIVRPVTRLGVAADRLRAGRLRERVEVEGPEELAGLGAAFNMMAETLESQQENLRQLAFADSLTGLPNRTAFVKATDAAGETGELAVLLIGLDDFKSVNDALGHPAGDALLIEEAERIRAEVAERDTVARLSGDTFAVLMPGRQGTDVLTQAVQAADRLIARVSTSVTIAEVPLDPGASVGIAVGTSAATLLREADVAMYEAKRAGGGRHATFEPAMQEKAARRLTVLADLRRALEEGQFRLLYQPIVDLRTRAVRATEALIRWEHPVRGLVSPAEFIPLAEQTGIIADIGAWVMHQACAQAAEWQHAFPDAERGMTVNLSARQLLEPDLVEQVRSALRVSGLPPENLVLEITESAVMADQKAAGLRLGELRRLGVRLAIDDFGTGHSSLAYLRELPVHDLKIAREFVMVMEESSNDLALVRGILALGHGLGLRAIAEGIETEEEHARLRGMGCDLGQGYLYARPLEAAAIAPMLGVVHAPASPGFVADTATDSVLVSALALMPDVAILTFDFELRATMVAGVLLERLGWRPDDLRGRRLHEVLPAARAATLDRAFRSVLKGEHLDFELPSTLGERRVRLEIVPTRDEEGAVTGGLLMARDTTGSRPETGAASAQDAPPPAVLTGRPASLTRPIRAPGQALGAARP